MFAILWFQYNALKQQRMARKNLKEVYNKLKKPDTGKKELKDDSVSEMLSEFK